MMMGVIYVNLLKIQFVEIWHLQASSYASPETVIDKVHMAGHVVKWGLEIVTHDTSLNGIT